MPTRNRHSTYTYFNNKYVRIQTQLWGCKIRLLYYQKQRKNGNNAFTQLAVSAIYVFIILIQ